MHLLTRNVGVHFMTNLPVGNKITLPVRIWCSLRFGFPISVCRSPCAALVVPTDLVIFQRDEGFSATFRNFPLMNDLRVAQNSLTRHRKYLWVSWQICVAVHVIQPFYFLRSKENSCPTYPTKRCTRLWRPLDQKRVPLGSRRTTTLTCPLCRALKSSPSPVIYSYPWHLFLNPSNILTF